MAALTQHQQEFAASYLLDYNASLASIRTKFELLDPAPIKQFYVYALIDPRDQSIIYIGKGKGKRWQAHESNARNNVIRNAKKHVKLLELFAVGRAPQAYFLAVCETEKKAYAVERAFIEAIGLKRLTNATRGEGSKHDREALWAVGCLRRFKPFHIWVAEGPKSQHDSLIYRILRKQLIGAVQSCADAGVSPLVDKLVRESIRYHTLSLGLGIARLYDKAQRSTVKPIAPSNT